MYVINQKNAQFKFWDTVQFHFYYGKPGKYKLIENNQEIILFFSLYLCIIDVIGENK